MTSNNESPKEIKITIKNYETIWPTLREGDKLYWSNSFRWVDIRWHSQRFGCEVGLMEWDEKGDFVVVTKSQANT